MDTESNKTNIVSSCIYGGQGNQMFQVAMALVIAKLMQCPAKFVKQDYATNGKIRSINWNTLFQRCETLADDLQFIKITDDNIDEFIDNLEIFNNQNILLDGYLQKGKFLLPYKDFFYNFFFDYFDNSKESQEIVNKYNPKGKIAIHIRSFELTATPNERNIHFYSTTPWPYYKSVLKSYEELQNKEILMFVDDISDVQKLKEYFPRYTIVDEKEDISLYIMSKCEYLIRSNSTFSWWASFLSNTLKRVFIPSNEWIIDNNMFNECNMLDSFIVHTL